MYQILRITKWKLLNCSTDTSRYSYSLLHTIVPCKTLEVFQRVELLLWTTRHAQGNWTDFEVWRFQAAWIQKEHIPRKKKTSSFQQTRFLLFIDLNSEPSFHLFEALQSKWNFFSTYNGKNRVWSQNLRSNLKIYYSCTVDFMFLNGMRSCQGGCHSTRTSSWESTEWVETSTCNFVKYKDLPQRMTAGLAKILFKILFKKKPAQSITV